MRRTFLMAALCLAFIAPVLSTPGFAQSSDADPATKGDIETYLRTMHSHDMMQKTMESMLKPMHQMFSDQLEKNGKTPPGDAEKRFNKMMDDLMKGAPLDEMTQAMVPVYQKHFTKGDINNLITFYSSPTGQRVLEEMPAIAGESMAAMMPIMRKYMEESKDRVEQEVEEMEKNPPRPNRIPLFGNESCLSLLAVGRDFAHVRICESCFLTRKLRF